MDLHSLEYAYEVCDDLSIDLVTASPPAHTIEVFSALGFTPDSNIPSFAYPDDRYITTLMWKNSLVSKYQQTFKNLEQTL